MYKLILICIIGSLISEIDADQYRTVSALVSLRPMITSQVREVFSDGVIDQNEFIAIRKAFEALDDEYKSDELNRAKKRLQNQLEKIK